ncbi:hypothetical protein JCM19274_392 [Algibacter lectus]|uniref:Uncharacterized protein n=1 Tax=Algibacter lectus TaxID=221126 RepID=A0A090X7B6_9FLAO|nr:hypothetical protein JCM19274_392 [Algibacter lectus]
MHVTRYKQKQSGWVEIKVNELELKKLNNYLLNNFEVNQKGMKIILQTKVTLLLMIFIDRKGVIPVLKRVTVG